MEIQFFDTTEPLRFQRILIYPYPDLRRLWVRMWLTPQLDKHPNIELRVMNPDGTENNSLYLLTQAEPKVNNTLHLRNPVPGETYHVIAEMTLGLGPDTELVERREFDMVLEFRDPEAGEPGFGFSLEEQSQEDEEPS